MACLFVFGKIGAQEQHDLRYGIAYKRSQFRMPADEKAHSGLMFAGGISRKFIL